MTAAARRNKLHQTRATVLLFQPRWTGDGNPTRVRRLNARARVESLEVDDRDTRIAVVERIIDCAANAVYQNVLFARVIYKL